MTDEWSEARTGTHQDHVVAHVVGATVLGWFAADDALHFALDIGFIWTVFADAEMGLVPESLALRELNLDSEARARLAEDLRRLHDGDANADDDAAYARITPAPVGCLIEEVRLLSKGELCRLEIRGEAAALFVEASSVTGEMSAGQFQV
ncbi:MAG TPA: hypothetical protein VF656_17025 [Pyrinomonadaceae bacterium]|jgi:hypothetical protein